MLRHRKVLPLRREPRRRQTRFARARPQEGQTGNRRPPDSQGKGQEKAGRKVRGKKSCFCFY